MRLENRQIVVEYRQAIVRIAKELAGRECKFDVRLSAYSLSIWKIHDLNAVRPN